MTSVERILEYCGLESEAPRETDTKPPKNWPTKGKIEFDNMSFRYHKTLPRVLHNISCCINQTEKVGALYPLTPRVKPWVIQSFLTFESMNRTLKWDHSLESCLAVLYWCCSFFNLLDLALLGVKGLHLGKRYRHYERRKEHLKY